MRRLARLDLLLFFVGIAVAVIVTEAALPFVDSPSSADTKMPTEGLVCLSPVVDLDRVDGTRPIKHTFELTNLSAFPVRIVETKVTCGCTSLEVDKSPVAPGESASATVTIDWNGRAGAQQAGIFIKTDAPGENLQRLQISGSVIYSAAVVPATINLGAGVGVATGRQFFVLGPETGKVDVVAVKNIPEGWQVARVHNSGELSSVLKGPPGRFIVFRQTEDCSRSANLSFVLDGDVAEGLTLPITVRD